MKTSETLNALKAATEVVEALSLGRGIGATMYVTISDYVRWRECEVPISYFGRTYAERKKITWKDGLRGPFDYCATSGRGVLRRWQPVLPLILLFLLTVLLNVEGGNMFAFLFVPLLWFAFAISEEISRARELAGGGRRGNF